MAITVGVKDSNVVFETGVLACLDPDPAIEASRVNGVRVDRPDLDVAIISADHIDAEWASCPLIVCVDAHRAGNYRATNGNVAAVLDRNRLASDQLRGAVHAVASGLRLTYAPEDARPLDERSISVLSLLAAGASTSEISADLGYSERTIKAIVSRVGARLGTRTRAHAVATAMRMELIH